MTQPNQVAAASIETQPSDNELVMGVVTSGNPLTVATRGDDILPGRLSTGEFMTGDTVAMIREGATWLALGKVIAGTGVGGMGLTQLLMAEASANLALTAADQSVAGTTINFVTTNPNALILAIWSTDYTTLAVNTSTSDSIIYIDGVIQSNQSGVLLLGAASQRAVITTANLLPVTTPGAHTVNIRARTSGGAGLVQVNSSNTMLIVAVIE